ncbi:MAG: hypothetical protein GX329_01600 [Tissierellia bacterium]|nr:hypothetical protein [Tissierellia bacterium]
MHYNRGFVVINSLLVMSIILIFSSFLFYMANMEYLILGSSQDSVQVYYLAESKIYTVLNMEYYHDLLSLRIEEFLKTGIFDTRPIDIRTQDLLMEDGNRKVDLAFDIEDDRRILKLTTFSEYNGIRHNLMSKLYILNDFYELGIPMVSEYNVPGDRLKDYNDYMDALQEQIRVPFDARYTIGIDGSDYDRINIVVEANGDAYAEYFRDDIEIPKKREYIGAKNENDRIFLVAKPDNLRSKTICIVADEGVDRAVLKGTLYIEGDIWILGNVDIEGILIIDNGSIIVDPSMEFHCNGLMLTRNFSFEGDNIAINYDAKKIKRCGVHIPGFIDLRMKLIKRK